MQFVALGAKVFNGRRKKLHSRLRWMWWLQLLKWLQVPDSGLHRRQFLRQQAQQQYRHL
jgi:hypothetical protein